MGCLTGTDPVEGSFTASRVHLLPRGTARSDAALARRLTPPGESR